MDDSAHNFKVKVSQEKALQLRQMYDAFEKMFAQAQAEFHNSTFATYYLVSKKFLDQWRQFCLSNDAERTPPPQMNIDLLDPATQKLKEGLTESEDFQIVNTPTYKIFSEYKATPENTLKRISYELNGEKKVPIYLQPILYLPIKKSDLENIDRKRIKAEDLKLLQIQAVSLNNSVQDFLSSFAQFQHLSQKYSIRCWLNKSQLSMKELWQYIAKETQPLSYWDMKIRGVGKLIQDQRVSLNSIGLEDGDYFIVECAEYESWFLRSPDQNKCQGCFKMKKLTHPCGCKKVGYCSASCQDKDIQYHSKYCSFIEEQELNKKIDMTLTATSSRGLVGLSNLGNTCFMNSCLQSLSHTLPLTDYFISQVFESEINKINPLGTKGKLAKAYATFIKNMWCQSSRSYSPYRLKSAVATINPMFSGYAQHDSQQFFSFLVDGLHQDLNRIEKKPYIESVESNDRPDSIVALQSWLAHVQRNQSIVVDLMTGQYKSKVTCPDCKKQSITFDPFITVTLPIPEEATVNELLFYVLFSNHQKETKKNSIVYRKANLDVWLQEAAKMLNRDKSEFKMYILGFNDNGYDFSKCSKNEIVYKIQSERKSVFLLELTPEEQQCQNQLELTFRLSKKHYGNSWESMWFKRPFWFKKGSATGLLLVKRILKYLYFDTYDKSTKRSVEGDTYEVYEEKMLENRPFKLFLRYQKVIQRHYSRVEINFEKQAPIQDDNNVEQLLQQLEITDLNDIDVDVRFNKFGLDVFTIQRLKKYTEGERQNKSSYYSQSKSSVTLDQCFQILQEPEQLQKGNEWYCSNCKDHKLATKQLTIYKAPQILILHLKRFKSKGIIRKEKNDTNVQFPQKLNIEKYVIDPKPINSYIPEVIKEGKYKEPKYKLETSQEINPNYELYAVSNHYGGLGGGHYTAYAKNNDKWYSFNDSSVSEVDEGSVRGNGAYILFYKRIKG